MPIHRKQWFHKAVVDLALKKNYCLCDDMRERVNMVAGIGCLHVLGGVVIEIFVQEVFSKILLFFSSVFGSGLPCR